ncbi:MAG: hypothetical protein D6731_25000 [Planctomycetota bacterium]|nr:MAG: hypothetical protein D6731_25000 [Planctomycetota bacterium]
MTENGALPPSDRVHPPTYERRDERGDFVEIVNEGPWETVIHGRMHAGATLGQHYHKECRALFYLVSGRAEVSIVHLAEGGQRSREVLGPRQGIYLLPYETHKIHFTEESAFVLLKSYRYDPEKPDVYPHPIA